MKKLQSHVLVLVCAMALTACSSGGGSKSHVAKKPHALTPSANANTGGANAGSNGGSNANSGTASGNSGATSGGSANANAGGAGGTNAGSNNSSNANSGTTSGSGNTASTSASFSDAMKKGMANMKRDTFNGTLIEINNKTGTVKGLQTANLNFEQFRLGSTKVLLLQHAGDKVKSTPLRKLTAGDFPDGGFAPKDSNNPGWIGSTYGSQNDPAFVGHGQQSFGRLRFGVYTDNSNTTHMFVHGNPAEATSVFSGATFRGSAVIGKDGDYRGLPKAVTAKIDKDITKVDVSIKTDKTTLNFGGDIDLASKTFGGKKGGVETRGGLFGEDSIGGFFNVTEGVHKGENGVYGASSGKDVAEDYGN